MVSSRAFATASLLVVLGGACGFDSESLPEPRASDGRPLEEPEPRDPKKLARASLMLAADSGHVDLIELLRKNSVEIDWSADGPVAMQFAARRGYLEVVRLLASYGVCGDEGDACSEALSEARVNGNASVVAFLETVVSP